MSTHIVCFEKKSKHNIFFFLTLKLQIMFNVGACFLHAYNIFQVVRAIGGKMLAIKPRKSNRNYWRKFLDRNTNWRENKRSGRG